MKLDVARKCGAEVVLNPTKCDVIEEVKKLSDGYGCDVYIEASGSPVSVMQGKCLFDFHVPIIYVIQLYLWRITIMNKCLL